jgi:hypothetical protein
MNMIIILGCRVYSNRACIWNISLYARNNLVLWSRKLRKVVTFGSRQNRNIESIDIQKHEECCSKVKAFLTRSRLLEHTYIIILETLQKQIYLGKFYVLYKLVCNLTNCWSKFVKLNFSLYKIWLSFSDAGSTRLQRESENISLYARNNLVLWSRKLRKVVTFGSRQDRNIESIDFWI